jgi:hypothetical protein
MLTLPVCGSVRFTSVKQEMMRWVVFVVAGLTLGFVLIQVRLLVDKIGEISNRADYSLVVR